MRFSRPCSWPGAEAGSSQSSVRIGQAAGYFCRWTPVPERLPLAGGLGGGAFSLTAASSLLPSLCRLCIGFPRSGCYRWEWNRQGVLADRRISCSFYLGRPGSRAAAGNDRTSAMGQLCCFPFSREEEKISKWDCTTVEGPKCSTILCGCLPGWSFGFFS